MSHQSTHNPRLFYCCCRHCHQEPENLDHVLRYNHTIGQEFRNALPHKFVNYKKEKTLQHCKSLSSLQRWVRSQAPMESTWASRAVQKLIHAQRQIGWTRFGSFGLFFLRQQQGTRQFPVLYCCLRKKTPKEPNRVHQICLCATCTAFAEKLFHNNEIIISHTDFLNFLNTARPLNFKPISQLQTNHPPEHHRGTQEIDQLNRIETPSGTKNMDIAYGYKQFGRRISCLCVSA